MENRIGAAITFNEGTYFSNHARAEIDSRADATCAGSTMRCECDYEQTVSVSGFHDGLGDITNIPIGTSVTAHDHPKQGTLILAFPQSLYCGESMKDSLINPNQLRANQMIVDTHPKHFSGEKSMHAI
jgi:hypothetical protein